MSWFWGVSWFWGIISAAPWAAVAALAVWLWRYTEKRVTREEFDQACLELWNETVKGPVAHNPLHQLVFVNIEVLNRKLFGPRPEATGPVTQKVSV